MFIRFLNSDLDIIKACGNGLLAIKKVKFYTRHFFVLINNSIALVMHRDFFFRDTCRNTCLSSYRVSDCKQNRNVAKDYFMLSMLWGSDNLCQYLQKNVHAMYMYMTEIKMETKFPSEMSAKQPSITS